MSLCGEGDSLSLGSVGLGSIGGGQTPSSGAGLTSTVSSSSAFLGPGFLRFSGEVAFAEEPTPKSGVTPNLLVPDSDTG